MHRMSLQKTNNANLSHYRVELSCQCWVRWSRHTGIQVGPIVHCICSVIQEEGICIPPPYIQQQHYPSDKMFFRENTCRKNLPLNSSPSLFIPKKKKKKQTGFLLCFVLSNNRDSESSRKGHSSVQNNDYVFKAIVVLSCGFRGKKFNHKFQLPELKAGDFGYSQNWLDVFRPVLTRYLLHDFLSSWFPHILFISVLSHTWPK